jgi:hypothetical protein
MGVLFVGHKAPGHEAVCLPSLSAKIINALSYTSMSPFVIMAWC